MSQPHKRKPKEARKEGTKSDSAKSKPGASMATQSSEQGKTKASESVKVDSSKPMSATTKSSEKPGAVGTHRSANSCKSKTTSGSLATSSGATGAKQKQPRSTATHQSKMGQTATTTSKLDTKERTLPAKVAGTSLHKNNDSKNQDGKPMLSAMEQLLEPFPSQGPDAPVAKCTGPAAKDKDALDLLAETLPSEAPDDSAPKYTGPEVKESDVTKKKGERVGERDDTIPPDYRFKEQPDPKDKGKPASSSAGPGAKPKVTEKGMTESDVLESLSADFAQSSSAPVSKCSAEVSHSAIPPSTQKQAPLQASAAATVSTSQPGTGGKDAFDLLAETLPSEVPDNSAPKYTGPEVKESDVTKQHIERMGDRDDTLPPDYRFKDQPNAKDKGQLPPSTDPKPKTLTESDVLDSLSADFDQSSPATISKCSAAPPSLQKEAPLQASTAASVSASQPGKKDKDALNQLAQTLPSEAPDQLVPKYTGPPVKAPLQASTAAPVSASLPSGKDKDPLDLLAATLPSEAPDDSAPKYTGPEVKESDVTKKKAERVGERDDTIPPDYRFKEQPDSKDKRASSSTGTGAKPKTMAEGEVLDALSADLVQSSPAQISKCSAPTAHAAAPPTMQKEAPLKASTAAPVSSSQAGSTGKDAFDLLAETLPSEAPDNSAPKYTGPEVKEAEVTKKKGERVGEREDTIPPDYRFKEQPDPKGKASSGPSVTDAKAKPKVLSEGDVLESLSADFVQSSDAPISKCSATTSQSAALPSVQKEAPLKASTAASVSASQTGAKDKDALDLLAETLPSEAPDDSAPKYTGPEVKESDATKKSIERVGERDDTIPPDYRFKKEPDSKDKGKPASSITSAGSQPKGMTEGDVLESLSADFTQSSAAPVSKCSALVCETAPPPAVKKEDKGKSKLPSSSTGAGTKPKTMPESDVLECLSADLVQSTPSTISKCSASPPSLQQQAPLQASTAASVSASLPSAKAPLQASTAASVSASLPSAKGKDAFDLLAETLPSEAPDNSAPKYTGPEVKESDASKKKAERVGETEESIPPDYRFTEKADPKDKGKPASSATGPGAKPKLQTMTEAVDSLSSDFNTSSSASHSVAPISQQKETGQKSAAKSDTKKAPKK